MIICKAISKKYAQEKVISNFSYSFPETGFILLFGESGCGKTTLLNILAGVTSFDEGEIIFKNEIYKNRVDWKRLSSIMGYITQDTHFIDYLTVLDNLKLSSMNDEAIMHLLNKFGLEDIKDNYPNTLSGGEKQRIAIIQALLGEKNILLLDEPTASLDRENKIIIFKMLGELKSNKLIICSSHDEEIRAYVDEIIDFNNLTNIKTNGKVEFKTVKNEKSHTKRNLLPFFKKQYTYPGRERKSKIQLIAVFFLAVIALCIADTPKNKADSNIEYTYNLNQIQISCKDINESLLKELENNKHVREVNLVYNRSVPDGIENEQDIISNVSYEMMVETIPFNADAFRLSDNIEYGSYYTKDEQIILSHDMAVSMGNPEDLIGQTLKVELYDKKYDMEIVGVFREFSKIEKQYLWASGVCFGADKNSFFINGEFTKRYIYDKNFFMHGERIYTVYFDTFDNMKAFYECNNTNKNGTKFIYADISCNILFLFKSMFAILSPMVLAIIVISLLLYYQTWKIKMVYNNHIFSLYQYLGYSVKNIKKCWIITSFEEVMKMLIIAIASAIPLMWIINILNKQINLIPFQIFTYNIYLILLMVVIIFVLNIIFSSRALNKVKIVGWYQILLENRDLI